MPEITLSREDIEELIKKEFEESSKVDWIISNDNKKDIKAVVKISFKTIKDKLKQTKNNNTDNSINDIKISTAIKPINILKSSMDNDISEDERQKRLERIKQNKPPEKDTPQVDIGMGRGAGENRRKIAGLF